MLSNPAVVQLFCNYQRCAPQSSAFWGFVDVLTKMGKRRPALVLLENVTGFLTANIYERSLLNAAECRITLGKLLARYNEIVASCETDPSLLVRIPEGPV